MTKENVLKLAEDLYYDETQSFCPICKLISENCNVCIGIDFHKEFVDLKKAEEYFGVKIDRIQQHRNREARKSLRSR